MEVYAVGGSVRDELLGLTPSDHDYVVTGATEAEMLKLGFEKVGADFPVFLHPQNGDQWALARIERKVAVGYHGFEVDAAPTVTIEDDLARRDLTINSMAKHTKTGELVDPYSGRRDLQVKVLRHTSKAFCEDPLRVLRLARFAGKFPDFDIAVETIELCEDMIKHGQLNELSQERIWAELVKALETPDPMRFFRVLYVMKAFGRVKGLAALRTMDADFTQALLNKTREPDLVLAWLIKHGGAVNRITEAAARGLPGGTVKAFDVITRKWDRSNPVSLLDDMQQTGATRGLWAQVRRAMVFTDPVELELLEQGVKAVNGVLAEPFLGLPGKEIGLALKHARIEALTKVYHHG
jgi:hypothetical protein